MAGASDNSLNVALIIVGNDALCGGYPAFKLPLGLPACDGDHDHVMSRVDSGFNKLHDKSP